jgi:hypothetical protein
MELTFGKHKGKTLPQVLFADPDWFFWACEEGVFQNRGSLAKEAEELRRRTTNIRIRQDGAEELVAEYVIHPNGKFTDLNFVPKSQPPHEGGSRTHRSDRIDLSFPRRLKSYDKLGCGMLVSILKHHYFGSAKARMTRKRCEEFFEDDKNFQP